MFANASESILLVTSPATVYGVLDCDPEVTLGIEDTLGPYDTSPSALYKELECDAVFECDVGLECDVCESWDP